MPRKRNSPPAANTIPAAPVVPVSELIAKQESEGIPLTDAEKVGMGASLAEWEPIDTRHAQGISTGELNVMSSAEGVGKSSFMQGVLKCHTCGRTGDEDLGECPNIQLPNYTCPEPTPIDPDTDVVLYSASLGVTRTVPVESLVRGHAQRYLAGCHSDDCGYKILHPKTKG